MSELQRLLAPGQEDDEFVLAALRSAEDDVCDEAARRRTLAVLGASMAGGAIVAKVGLGKWLWTAIAGKWLNVVGVVAISATSIGIYAAVEAASARSTESSAVSAPAAPTAQTSTSTGGGDAPARGQWVPPIHAPEPAAADTANAASTINGINGSGPAIANGPTPGTTPQAGAKSDTRLAARPGSTVAKLGLSDEIARLDDARRALVRGDPQTTLVLVDRYERDPLPHALSQEAMMLRIEALVALGRKDEARSYARRLLAANPGTYEDRVRSLLGDIASAP